MSTTSPRRLAARRMAAHQRGAGGAVDDFGVAELDGQGAGRDRIDLGGGGSAPLGVEVAVEGEGRHCSCFGRAFRIACPLRITTLNSTDCAPVDLSSFGTCLRRAAAMSS